MWRLLLLLALVACNRPGRSGVASGAPEAQPWPELAVAEVPALRTDTRPLPRDVAAMRRVSQVRMAPDGKAIAYIVRAPSFDPDAKPSDDDPKGGWTVSSQLWLAPTDPREGAPRQLTVGDASASSPRFSPDGRHLAFLRSTKGKRRLHVLPLGGGEPRVLDTGEHTPGSFAWSPDGTRLAFLAKVPETDEAKEARFRRGGAYRWDQEWRSSQPMVLTLEGGEPVHVHQGDDHVVQLAWSPDGASFALLTAESSNPYEAWMQHRLRIVSASDGSTQHEVETEPGSIQHMAWSPDGKHLAYERAHETLSLHNQLRLFTLATGQTRELTEGMDLSLDGFVWTGDAALLVSTQAKTRTELLRFRLSGAPSVLAHGDEVLALGTTDDRFGRVAVIASTATRASAPGFLDLRRGRVETLHAINPQVDEWSLAEVSVVSWDNVGGEPIEGVLYRSPHHADGPGPLMVLPHGGPDSVTQERFSSWGHFFAARGYSVLRPNYRGGFGYGRAFYAANRGRLGDIELEDIEPGVDHLIEAGIADAEQLYYGGWSWGGYLSAWTLGHTGTRYRAFVVGAGVNDNVLGYVTSDINHGIVADWEYLGRPWREPESYARSNPARFLQNAQQPTLVIHGEADDRVSFVNWQLLYRALRDAGCEVDFWAYPREPHGFREPAHVEHMLTQWAAWYDGHRE
ncbi:MAG: S9 family peptidase [Myxococcota bacterium]